MRKFLDYRVIICLSFVVTAALLAGCAGQAPKEEEAEPVTEQTETAPAEATPAELSEEELVKLDVLLAKFDAVDGAVDKVVSKCPGCKLTMDGLADQKLDVAGYQLHFCAEECKKSFEEGAEKAILALEEI